MLGFSQYLTEAAKFENEDLQGGHLEHVEDYLVNHGKGGFRSLSEISKSNAQLSEGRTFGS